MALVDSYAPGLLAHVFYLVAPIHIQTYPSNAIPPERTLREHVRRNVVRCLS